MSALPNSRATLYGTPLARKLGLRPGQRALFEHAPSVATDVTEDVVRELALTGDLVDVKVVAIDSTWSGLKLVIRREAR